MTEAIFALIGIVIGTILSGSVQSLIGWQRRRRAPGPRVRGSHHIGGSPNPPTRPEGEGVPKAEERQRLLAVRRGAG
jgi:hypothetical protein